MTDESRPTEPEAAPADHRLQSWKEIAAYFDREVRTVQRWEGQFGLPVYRNQGQKRSAVYAWQSELDAWQAENHVSGSTNGRGFNRTWLPWSVAAIAAVIAAVGFAAMLGGSRNGAADGTGLIVEQLANFQFTSGRVSPDGRWLVYRDADRVFLRLKSLHEDIEDRLLVDEPIRAGLWWSPESDRVVYRIPQGDVVRFEWIEIEGGQRHEFLSTRRGGGPAILGWLPDGEALLAALPGGTDGRRAIVAVDVTTGAFEPLGDVPAVVADGTLAPNGRLVAFSRPGRGSPGARPLCLRPRGWNDLPRQRRSRGRPECGLVARLAGPVLCQRVGFVGGYGAAGRTYQRGWYGWVR